MRRRDRRSPIRAAAVAGALHLVAGCHGDPITAVAHLDPSTLPGAVVVAPRGITLAVADTQRLSLATFTAAGSVLSRPDLVRFTSADSTRVRVDTAGLLTALAVTTQPLRVIGAVTHRGVTIADTVYVVVTATATPVVAMTLQPVPPDSAKGAQLSSKVLRGTFTKAAGGTVNTPYVYLSVQSRTLAQLTPLTQAFTPRRVGPLWVYGSASVYGVQFTDSVRIDVSDPIAQTVYMAPATGTTASVASTGVVLYLALNGTASFFNGTSQAGIGVTLSDPTAFTGGDIPSIGASASVTRKAIKAGRYTWTLSSTPALSGTIVVR